MNLCQSPAPYYPIGPVFQFGPLKYGFLFFKGNEACQGQRVARPGEADICGILPQCGDRRGGERVHVGLQSSDTEAGGAAEEEGAVADNQEGDGEAASATRGGMILV